MSLESIEILGYRGFGRMQRLVLAIPNGKPGSGLTVVVGPNNSGKSTIFEALNAISQSRPPSIPEGRRNAQNGYRMSVKVNASGGGSLSLQTVAIGGSETEFNSNGLSANQVRIFPLPSRRSFAPFFIRGSRSRLEYLGHIQLPAVRGSQLEIFHERLFNIQKNPEQISKFNSMLSKILQPVPSWYIERSDGGQYYLKFTNESAAHTSDGTGEGLLSLFTIVDSLYDSTESDIIAIDEPELSLHPSLQRKLIDLLGEVSSTRQIVIFTHSPYFIDWSQLVNGATVARTSKCGNGNVAIHQLRRETILQLATQLENINNPHVLGLDSKEVFFLSDGVILVEGQEDVVILQRIIAQFEKDLAGNFYGWGAGGASNVDKILQMLKELGFVRVATILDANKKSTADQLAKQFPTYFVRLLPTDDIRDKDEVRPRLKVLGLTDKAGRQLKKEHLSFVSDLIRDIQTYLSRSDL